ncbi:S8 family peptidase [Thermoactinospora rubra]|uniref:S8 family peptidase n=1 Tax=Thermoactinospora rubra TaxID=1088767 RepID=UPI000A0FEFB8|nr:S8 family peptidase [Thermoactinospora rubra]
MRSILATGSALAAVAAALALPSPAHAAPPYDPHTVIVKYRPAVPEAARRGLERRSGGTRLLRTLLVGADLVQTAEDPARVAARLARDPSVEYAAPNHILTADAPPPVFPGDPRFAEQYHLHNTGQTGGLADADVDAPEGYFTIAEAGVPGAPVKVGVVDSGIDKAHEDLAANVVACARSTGAFNGGIVEGSCHDGNGHGTHVAGILAAKAGNARGGAGVAFNARLVVCKALDNNLRGTVADVSDCILWTWQQGAKVINMSLGGRTDHPALHQAIQNAWQLGLSQGATLVASAGNVALEDRGTPFFPAAYEEVVAVSATTDRDQLASFSNTGSFVDVAAPGEDVLSTIPGDQYAELDGTSMAAPVAAGVATAIRARFPTMSASGAASRLKQTVDDLGLPGRDDNFGHGRVNLCNAVATVAAQQCG